jgi:hypothetical protein
MSHHIEAYWGLLIVVDDGIEPVPVPLTGVSVDVRIIDLVAEVSIEQRYVNRESNPIEAVYKFPLDEGAAVCQFMAEVDGRQIKGVVKETKEAEADYEKALSTGHTAFFLKEKLPDVFKVLYFLNLCSMCLHNLMLINYFISIIRSKWEILLLEPLP